MATDLSDIPRHSVHTLVFRSLKRTHDMFLSDYSHPVEVNQDSMDFRRSIRLKNEYDLVLHMPKDSSMMRRQTEQAESAANQEFTPSSSSAASNNDNSYNPSSNSARGASMVPLPEEADEEYVPQARTSSFQNEISPIFSTNSSNPSSSKALTLFSNDQNALIKKKALMTMPKPQWHPPWKLYRVISGHSGWVRCVDVDPSNEWFATGSGDRIIKIWDLASGTLKLSLTGHVSTVRGVCISPRHPYLFSCGEDKQVKCWDLETNKVIRHYHGHLAACYCLALHPSLDVLVSAGRDSIARLWDMRTKAQIHALEGHTNTIASVKCQEVDPQIITASHDSTIRCWDIVAGKTMVTLTNHKKSVRALALHPKLYMMASASPDNIKQWKFPSAEFIQNMSGHNAVINGLACNSENVLVSGADNGSLFFWDWLTGYNFQRMQSQAQSGSIESEAGVLAMTFDQSGSRLITCEADKTIKLYKEDEEATEETHPLNWKPDILKRKRF